MTMDIEEIKQRSIKIRRTYHKLEKECHGSKWSIEEDALAFLTDAGLIGRLTMDNQQRWPVENGREQLQHKIGECIWWLMVLSERMNIDIESCIEKFLSETEQKLL